MKTIKAIKKLCTVTNDRGIKFNVTLENSKYGRVVVFYDTRYLFTNYGQSVSGYGVETIMEVGNNGINLQGGVEDWYITAENLRHVQRILKTTV
jgi:hypothetical protein